MIGVEQATGNDAFLSLSAGKRIEIPPPETIADGLRVTAGGEIMDPV